MIEKNDNWIPLTEAAKRFGISLTKLSNMAKAGEISVRKNARDRRVRWVSVSELEQLFPPLPNEG